MGNINCVQKCYESRKLSCKGGEGWSALDLERRLGCYVLVVFYSTSIGQHLWPIHPESIVIMALWLIHQPLCLCLCWGCVLSDKTFAFVVQVSADRCQVDVGTALPASRRHSGRRDGPGQDHPDNCFPGRPELQQAENSWLQLQARDSTWSYVFSLYIYCIYANCFSFRVKKGHIFFLSLSLYIYIYIYIYLNLKKAEVGFHNNWTYYFSLSLVLSKTWSSSSATQSHMHTYMCTDTHKH